MSGSPTVTLAALASTHSQLLPPLPPELDDSSVEHMLRLIYPQLEAQLMLAKNVQLIEGLQEIQIHEQDSSCLSPQCQYILGGSAACSV